MRTVFPSLRQNAFVSMSCVSQRHTKSTGKAASVPPQLLHPPGENQTLLLPVLGLERGFLGNKGLQQVRPGELVSLRITSASAVRG